MTFTAVARCPRTGRLGVGMATRAPAVGNRCPIVRSGYGAASVQLIADPRQTMLCGRLLDLGYSATKVVKAMADSLESSKDEELWERLMRAVEAGGKAGGQAEGQRSAALLVFGAEPFALVDLRVDFHPEPISELRRIYDWFRPLVPNYQERVIDPYIIREDIWRENALAERADG